VLRHTLVLSRSQPSAGVRELAANKQRVNTADACLTFNAVFLCRCPGAAAAANAAGKSHQLVTALQQQRRLQARQHPSQQKQGQQKQAQQQVQLQQLQVAVQARTRARQTLGAWRMRHTKSEWASFAGTQHSANTSRDLTPAASVLSVDVHLQADITLHACSGVSNTPHRCPACKLCCKLGQQHQFCCKTLMSCCCCCCRYLKREYSALKPFVIISLSYLLFTTTDGAVRWVSICTGMMSMIATQQALA
jgi:hypothetical protein